MALEWTDRTALSLIAEPAASHGPVSGAAVPRLNLTWERRGRNFAENIRALLHGPAAPRKVPNGAYFRDCYVSSRMPGRALLASTLWHTAFVLALFPFLQYVTARPQVALPQVEITWYGPAWDLPMLFPVTESTPAPASEHEESQPDQGSPAYHPRQTILNRPVRPNHPRQTLIQPTAAPEPPKILPPLPNIVAWNTPSGPRLPIDAAALRAKPRAATPQEEMAAPELPDSNEQLDGLNLIAAQAEVQKPALLVSLLSAPRARSVEITSQTAPDINLQDSSGQSLIALSAMPAPVAPPAELQGNLSSRLSISPDIAKPGVSGASSPGTPEISGSGSGPPGLIITGGTPNRSEFSPAGRGGNARMPIQPGTAAIAAAGSPSNIPSRAQPNAQPGSFIERLKPGVPPESLFDARRVYTLHVNMPNLTSASGSWILNFAELASPGEQKNEFADPADLEVPKLQHKVDPKYPPELRNRRVEGEVVLYAVVRADGAVDSIQLIEGIDPTLDLNAMQALARWRFLPAQRGGVPVELEAIVHIPWRASAPVY